MMVKRISQDEVFLSLLPSKWWVRFFKKFDEIEEKPVSKWKEIHQLSYITKRYEDTYGKHFSFTLTGRPGTCTEIYLIKRLMGVLGTSNQHTIKDYIDWVYDRKVIPRNKKFRSIGFFANPQFCNEFHLDRMEKNKITRGTLLPAEYKSIADKLDLPMETFGDLAFAKQALDEAPEAESRKPYKILFTELYKVGFEYTILKEIK